MIITEGKTMTRERINPETLKQNRNRAGLSQQGLADVSGVSKKTIARIEAGKSSANTNTVRRLAEALDAKPEELSGQSGLDEREKRLSGFRTLKAPIHDNTELAFQMVEKHYGIPPRTQVVLAPLLAAILAEGSLAWRRQKLEVADEAADTLMGADYGHRLFVVGGGRAKEGVGAEWESLEQRDVFGEKVMECAADDMGVDPEPTDPFTEYLRHLARQFGTERINVLQERMTDEIDLWGTSAQCGAWSSLSYSINPEELDRLTGGDFWAGMALKRGHVKISDIPEDLLDDNASDKRIEWLGNKIPQDERDEIQARSDEIYASF